MNGDNRGGGNRGGGSAGPSADAAYTDGARSSYENDSTASQFGHMAPIWRLLRKARNYMEEVRLFDRFAVEFGVHIKHMQPAHILAHPKYSICRVTRANSEKSKDGRHQSLVTCTYH